VQAADAPPAPSRPSRRAAGLLGAAISIAVLVALVWWALRQEPPSLPTSGARLAELAAAILLYFVACALRGERWHVLLLENGARPRRADSYGLIAVGYLGNNMLPARAGDALRVVLIAPRASTDARTAIGTLVAERLCDVLVLGVLFAFLAYGLFSGAGADLSGRFELVALVVAAVVVVGALVAALLHYHGHLRPLLRYLAPMAAATRNLRGRHGAEVLVLTLAVWAVEGLVWWLTAEAAGLGISLVEGLYLLALSSMMVLVPAGPGYAGTMDAAVVIGARALKVGGSAAVTYLLLLRFVLMVPIGIAGLAIGATRYGGVQRLLRLRASA
jgi:glycosyltransferase 2 family protein